MVNTIYWATDDPARPKSHDRGVPVRPGGTETGDLLIIPGPLGWNFRGNRLIPRLEAGELAWYDPPVTGRAGSWIDLCPRVGSDLFIKLFTHGTQEQNSAMLLGGGLADCLQNLARTCTSRGAKLRYASAWQMRQAVWTSCETSPGIRNGDRLTSVEFR
jgi:hypothetical protein